MDKNLRYYQGRVPACGVFCGGCPMYTKVKNPCPGAGINTQRCENCKTFHQCCKERNITNCHQCNLFPCYKFRRFAKTWLKYGQDLIENQKLLKQIGPEDFLKQYNSKVDADAMRYTIAQIEKITEKRSYYPLLLDADPSLEMVEKYLKKGKMFTFAEEDRVVGEVVVLPLSATDIEIKNIAVLPEKQGQGLGRCMIEFVARHYADQFKNLYVGTADSGIAFYQKFGFEVSHRVKNFFTDNYPEPIIDSGIQCIDMIYLLRKL